MSLSIPSIALAIFGLASIFLGSLGQTGSPSPGWSFPTGFPTGWTFPTGLPTGWTFPTGLPTGWTFPTGLPTGWTIPPGPWTTPPPIFPIQEALVEAGDLGKIQGALTFTSPNGKKFVWFAGIPYADPESYTENNRFKPSSIKTGLLSGSEEESFNALNPLIFCPQRDIFYAANKNDLGSVLKAYVESKTRKNKGEEVHPQVQGVEECLVINVNTPKIPREGDGSELLPVIFFIHGGSFDSIWGGIFGGHRFLNRDVVLVSINYRLGLLGSLNLGVDDAPGNAAMYDVVTALEWVQKYIHHFGGDNSSVTVTGHSAGAVMATHLLTSPLVKDSNLFHKVIGLSGSSVSPWATCVDPIPHYLRTATHAGCDSTADRSEIAACMRTKTPEELINALNRWEGEDEALGRFGFDAKIPSLQDPETLDVVPVFMDETPLDVFRQGKQSNVPVMLGATRHDGSFLLDSTHGFLKRYGWLDDMPKFRNEFMALMLGGLGVDDTTGALLHSFAYTYLGPEAMNSDNFTDMIPGMIDIHSVIAFKAGAYNLIELHSKVNPNSYYFAFDYFGMWTVDGGDEIPGVLMSQTHSLFLGVGHIDSVFYLFQAFPLIAPRDVDVANRFVDYWVNFAITGNPNGNDGTDEIFHPYNPDTHTFLIINGTDEIGFNCRDSWIDNSIEIKDNFRPGPWPGPTAWPSWPSPTTTSESPDIGTSDPSDPSDPTTERTGETDTTTRPPQSSTEPNFAEVHKASAFVLISLLFIHAFRL